MPPSDQSHSPVLSADSDAWPLSPVSVPASRHRKVFFPLDFLNVGGAKILLQLLRDPNFALSLGNRGLEYVISEFSFQRMIENTDQLYTELLRQRGIE